MCGIGYGQRMIPVITGLLEVRECISQRAEVLEHRDRLRQVPLCMVHSSDVLANNIYLRLGHVCFLQNALHGTMELRYVSLRFGKLLV